MENIFTVKKEDIERLTPEASTDLIGDLLWAEAMRIGLSKGQINVAKKIDVPDGGVDASVRDITSGQGSTLLQAGDTVYQIKAGKQFEPWQKTHVRKLLFGNKKGIRKDLLGSSVRTALEKGARFIVVCTGQDINESRRNNAMSHITAYLKECGFDGTEIEVWGSNNIKDFLKSFPSLALQINGLAGARFQTHAGWSQNSDMEPVFQAGKAQKDRIAEVREKLRGTDKPVHIRVQGDPGIGKTRFVLETTAAEDLSPLVLYCESPAQLNDGDLLMHILRDDNHFSAILIVDECDEAQSKSLWNKIRTQSPRIKLITIYSDTEDTTGHTELIEVDPLGENELELTIKSYGIAKYNVGKWVDFCSGSPRAAHIIGNNLREHPEDLLRSPDNVQVWERFARVNLSGNKESVEKKLLVLQTMALFKRFGFEGGVKEESDFIAGIVFLINSNISKHEFRRIVKEFKSEGIVKGWRTLQISPKLLHVWLWREWWNTYGHDFDPLQEPFNDMPGSLSRWFREMFEYAKESEITTKLAKKMLSPEGPFRNLLDLTKGDNARFLLTLSKASPEDALATLRRIIEGASLEELEHTFLGRHEIVEALECLSFRPHLFNDVADLLIRLAIVKNESWNGNEYETFTHLFSPICLAFTTTHADAEARLLFLENLITSQEYDRRILAINACNQALDVEPYTRFGIPWYQGLQDDIKLRESIPWKDIYHYYQRVWQLLSNNVREMPPECNDEKEEVIHVLIGRARGLIRYATIADKVIDTFEYLASDKEVENKKLLTEIHMILHSKDFHLSPEILSRLEELRDFLTGEGFPNLLRRYVGMSVVTDHWDDEGNRIDLADKEIMKLAKQACEEPGLLQEELSWLLTEDAQHAGAFGAKLGECDCDWELWNMIVDAVEKAGGVCRFDLPVAYLATMSKSDPDRFQASMDFVQQHKILRRSYHLICGHTGITEKSTETILQLAQDGVINPGDLWVFIHRTDIDAISEDVFLRILDYLISASDPAATKIALHLLYNRCVRSDNAKRIPELQTFGVLIHDSIQTAYEMDTNCHSIVILWKNLAYRFIQHYPERRMDLACFILDKLGLDRTMLDHPELHPLGVLTEITRYEPFAIWSEIMPHLSSFNSIRDIRLMFWLRGHYSDRKSEQTIKAPIDLIPYNMIWSWLEEHDTEYRVNWFASFLPRCLRLPDGTPTIKHEFLCRYGSNERIRSNVSDGLLGEVITGPIYRHHKSVKVELENLLGEENNPHVKIWIRERIQWHEKQIEPNREKEERELW